MTPIVFQALPKWDGNYNSTALTISKALSEGRKVFYVEHPFSYTDLLRKRNIKQINKRKGGKWDIPFRDHPDFIVIHPPLILPFNKLKSGSLYDWFKSTYIKKLWKHIDKVLSEYEVSKFGYVNSFDPVFFSFNSTHACLFKIYHSVDLISGEPYIARHGVEAEKRASEQADAVVTTSYPLKDRLRSLNLHTRCIPNAVDYDHFSHYQEEPEEYRNSNRKKLVYTGNIGLRIDYRLLEKIADSFTETDIYMVGPQDPVYFNGSQLMNKRNVHFLGPKNFEHLPAYIQHADACIIPFICNELTYHIYPLKLNEYLSTGKPVVTSDFTRFGEFESLLRIYRNSDEARECVQKALSDTDADRAAVCKSVASENTWNNRLSDWKNLIQQLDSRSSSKNMTFHPA